MDASHRQERLDKLINEYEPMDTDGLIPEKWLLIERSGDGSYYFTVHLTIDAASMYWAEQEQPGDWDPVILMDLDTGQVHDPFVTYEVRFRERSEDGSPVTTWPFSRADTALRIATFMSGREWHSEDFGTIAEILRDGGFKIAEPS